MEMDNPLVEEDTSTRISCGETPSAIQLQLGPLGTDTGLSTVVQSLHDVDRRERTGGETSPVTLRQCACERNTSAEDTAHIHSDYIVEEGEEKKKQHHPRVLAVLSFETEPGGAVHVESS